jgi:two-component system sensor histidine kinase YesM
VERLFKNYRLDRLFFLCFALFIVMLLGVIVYTSFFLTSRELVKNTSFYQNRILMEIDKQLNIQMSAMEQTALASARNLEAINTQYDGESDPYFAIKRSTEMISFLKNLFQSTSLIHSVYLYIDNPPASNNDIALRIFPLSQANSQTWYPIMSQNDGAWLGKHAIESYAGDTQVISYARKLYANSGKILGILIINLKGTRIDEILKGEGDTVNRVLLDGGGRLITSVGNIDIYEQMKALPRNTMENSGQLKMNLTGQSTPSLVVWSGMKNQWFLAEATPWNSITAGSWRIAALVSGVGIVSILIALFYTFFISKQFNRPIHILLQTMAKYPFQNTTSKLPIDYRNEYGSLFQGYTRLMERIDELLVSLELQNKLQRKKESEALQAMINPHFLYNTLDQLNWMALEQGQSKISDILSLMGKMFRIGLSHGEPFIPIYDEISHIECYLQIQLIRWGKGITFEIDISQELYELYIPRVTLQPFIENAFLHGFRGRSSGHIRVAANVIDNDICFTIEDNGKGLEEKRFNASPKKKGGYGLRNVRERLHLYFGERVQMVLLPREHGGTIATIRFPQIKDPADWGGTLRVEDRSH